MDKKVPQKGPSGAGQGQGHGNGHTPFEATFDKWRRSYERDHAEHISKLGEIMRKDMEDRLSSYRLQLEEEEKAEIKKAKEAKDKRLSKLKEEEEAEMIKARQTKDNRLSKLKVEEDVDMRKAKEAKDKRLSKLKEDEAAELKKVKEAIGARLDAFRKEEEAKVAEKISEIRQKMESFETSFAASRSFLEQTVKNFHGSLSQETPQGTKSPNVDVVGSGGQNPPPQSPPTKERAGMPPKKKKSPPEDPASTSGSSLKRLRKDYMGETETETNSATTGGGIQATTSAPVASTSTSAADTGETIESLSLDLDDLPTFSLDTALKFFKDLHSQLKQSSLSYLKVSGTFSSQREVLLLDKIFQMVSPTLQHLVLDVTTQEGLNARFISDWTFGKNLKILEISVHRSYYPGFHQLTNDVFHKICPTSLEKFVGRGDYGIGPDILPDLAKRNVSTLTEISLSGSRFDELHSLAEIPTNLPLQKLTLNGSDNAETIYKILQKFSKSLVSLNLKCFTKLVIPCFEKLELFNLEYNKDTWISPGDFIYSIKFPALKTLTLDSSCKGRALSSYTKAEAVRQWMLREDGVGGVVDAFVPTGDRAGAGYTKANASAQVCLTLVELNIPHCPPGSKEKNKEYDGMTKVMRQLFPNVKGTWIQGL